MSLHFAAVSAAYRGQSVFTGASLSMNPGELMGLIGPNGAGKTTMLRIAAGLITPSAGRVVREGAVMYFGGEATLPAQCRADLWARLFGATSSARTRIGRLSRGTRQMLGLSACLARDDWSVGLLDEPWEGLDPHGSRWLAEALRRHRERGVCVLISSHRLHDVAEICSSYAFLAHGTLGVPALADIARVGSRADAGDLERAFHEFTRR